MLEPISAAQAGTEPPPTHSSAIRKLGRIFHDAGIESSMLDARILMAEACGRDQCGLILNRSAPVSAEEAQRIATLATRRLAGEPVSRILGRREFWGLSFRISPATLDPRPETELLVEAVLGHVRAMGQELPHPVLLPEGRRDPRIAGAGSSCVPSSSRIGLRMQPLQDASSPRRACGERDRVRGDLEQISILDLGTGSGCILGALLSELPQARGIGLDRSEAALAVARDNLSQLGLRDRASFLCGDWMSAVGGGGFDVIVCNPPYIAPAEIRQLAPEVRVFDPYIALDGGEDGLEAYRIVIPQAHAALRRGGVLVFEVGHHQSEEVFNLMKHSVPSGGYPEAWILADLAGTSRAVAAVRQS